MPLPSATIGEYNFGNQYAAQAQLAQGSQQLAQQTARLGASISASITENIQRKEAQQLGPQLAATYQQGFKDIMSGNPAGGLSTIYGASMQASTNPFLARMAESATTAANWATNNFMKQQMQLNSANTQEGMAAARNAEWERRQGIVNDEWTRRNEAREQPTAKQLTSQYNTYWNSRDKLMEDLAEARDANDAQGVARLRDRILEEDALAITNGLKIKKADGSEFLTKEASDKLAAARKQFQELTTSGVKGPEVDKVIREYNSLMNGVKASGEELLNERIKQFGSQSSTQEDLPSGPVGNEDVIPMAPDPNALTQGTPAQQQMQAAEQEQAAILQQVQQGTLTREQAIEIARQRGWN